MRDSEPTRCPLTGDAATIGGSSELMAVEHHKLGSYRLEAGARDVLEANSHVRESVAAWILDLHEHRAKTPVLSVELVRFFERLVELDSMIRTWRDVGQRISANDNDRLWKKLKLEWNYNSNHIEGNTLTYHETELLLIFGRTSGGHPMRDYEEMKAHDVAIDHVRKLAEEERDLSEAEIRQLNEIILKEPFWAPAETPEGQSTRKCIIPGEYKRDQNHVRTSTGALHKFAEPSDTPSLMAAWTRDFRHDMTRCAYPLPLFLAESHNGLLAIHPFGDGNGRTARLLVNFALLRRRLPPIVIKAEDRDRYIEGLENADLGHVMPLATFMMENTLWSLDLAIRAANGESIEHARDVDKELEVFVRRRQGDPPEKSAVEILDKVFVLHVQRTVEALNERLKPLSSLFRRRSENCTVRHGATNVSSGGLFLKNIWEEIKGEYLVTTGFRLSDETEIVLTYEVKLSDYVGRGNLGFGMTMAVAWSLGAEGCRWETTIDSRPESDLGGSVYYAALSGPPGELDDWTTGVCRVTMDAVDRKAGTQE